MIRGKIRIPRCWVRLIDDNFCYADDQCSRLSVEGQPHITVRSTNHREKTDDPNPYYNDWRLCAASFENDDLITVEMTSDNNRYSFEITISRRVTGLTLDDKSTEWGQTIYHNEDGLLVIGGETKFETEEGQYVLEVELFGDDPYESGYPEEPEYKEE